MTLARVFGLVLMIAAGAATYWLLTSDQFEMDQVELSADVRYADVDAMLAAAGLAPGEHPSVFRVPTEEMRRTMLAFPGIADAQVRAVLPNRVVVSISERSPVMVLRRPAQSFAIDGEGIVLAALEEQEEKRRKKEQGETPPDLPPDETKVDQDQKGGKRVQVKPEDVTTPGAAEAWMREVQTSPADFLKLKFSIQAATSPESPEPGR